MMSAAAELAPVAKVASAVKEPHALESMDIQEGSISTEFTEAEYKQLLRKIDLLLM
jgi:hypothetical protein